MTRAERAELRRLVADYMSSEGCSCCRLIEEHVCHAKALARALKVQKYSDGSGYNFHRYCTQEQRRGRR